MQRFVSLFKYTVILSQMNITLKPLFLDRPFSCGQRAHFPAECVTFMTSVLLILFFTKYELQWNWLHSHVWCCCVAHRRSHPKNFQESIKKLKPFGFSL